MQVQYPLSYNITPATYDNNGSMNTVNPAIFPSTSIPVATLANDVQNVYTTKPQMATYNVSDPYIVTQPMIPVAPIDSPSTISVNYYQNQAIPVVAALSPAVNSILPSQKALMNCQHMCVNKNISNNNCEIITNWKVLVDPSNTKTGQCSLSIMRASDIINPCNDVYSFIFIDNDKQQVYVTYSLDCIPSLDMFIGRKLLCTCTLDDCCTVSILGSNRRDTPLVSLYNQGDLSCRHFTITDLLTQQKGSITKNNVFMGSDISYDLYLPENISYESRLTLIGCVILFDKIFYKNS